jgi:hypothetical protein
MPDFVDDCVLVVHLRRDGSFVGIGGMLAAWTFGILIGGTWGFEGGLVEGRYDGLLVSSRVHHRRPLKSVREGRGTRLRFVSVVLSWHSKWPHIEDHPTFKCVTQIIDCRVMRWEVAGTWTSLIQEQSLQSFESKSKYSCCLIRSDEIRVLQSRYINLRCRCRFSPTSDASISFERIYHNWSEIGRTEQS